MQAEYGYPPLTAGVKERALGQDVLDSLNPGQQVVKVVADELTELMGGSGRELACAKPGPTVILMAGLQGSGKTTATGKLARHLKEEHGMDVGVAACDVYRPAAVDVLERLAVPPDDLDRVLGDRRVERCTVVEIEPMLVEWMRDGTIPYQRFRAWQR